MFHNISLLYLSLHLNLLVYDRNIFGSSSIVFGILWQSSVIFGKCSEMFGNVPLAFGTVLENLWKSSESGRKSSENCQKRRHQHVYIIGTLKYEDGKARTGTAVDAGNFRGSRRVTKNKKLKMCIFAKDEDVSNSNIL